MLLIQPRGYIALIWQCITLDGTLQQHTIDASGDT